MNQGDHPAIERLFSAHDAEADGHAARCSRCRALRRLGYERTLRRSACADVEPLLAARAVGAIDADDERLLLEHLEVCTTCFAVASDLDGAVVGQALVDLGIDADDFPELRTVASDNYVRGEEIGRGGMGRIVRARDRRLGRSVVLKELLDERLRDRFEQEARLTARLQHPAIVNVHEAGRWPSGDSFYAMKYVAGQPLDRAIYERRTLAARLELLPNLITVVDAVAYAHSVHVIHRDLKPANIIVGPFGETVVIDWGLAKDLTAADSDPGGGTPYRDDPGALTAGGAGTPSYMPPEQAAGLACDERVDVYALGATLYHLLAGDRPRGATPLAQLEPLVPRALAAIVSKAMALDPAARYASARELADELRRFQSGQLVAAHDYTLAERLAQFVRRNRALVALATASAVALAAVGGVSLSQVLSARRESERQLAELLLGRGRQELLRDAPSRALPYLVEARRHGLDGPALRAMVADAARPLDSRVAGFTIPGARPARARFSSDGARLATVDAGGVHLWSVPDGRQVAVLAGHPQPPRVLDFSPDGALLLTEARCEEGCVPAVLVWDAGGGALRLVLPLDAPLEQARFAGPRTVLARTHDGARTWDATTGLPVDASAAPAADSWPIVGRDGRLTWSRPEDTTITADVSPDGSWTLDLGLPGDTAVYLWHHGRPELLRSSFDHRGMVALARLAPDARAALTVGTDGVVKLWDARLAVARAIFDAQATPLIDAELSADGRRLLTLGTDNRANVWRVDEHLLEAVADPGVAAAPAAARGAVAPGGSTRARAVDASTVEISDGSGRPRARIRDELRIDTVTFDAAGRRLLTTGGALAAAIWDLDGHLLAAPAIPAGMVSAAAWSPDGERVVTGGRDGSLEVWDAATGTALAHMRAGDAPVDRAAFLDGARVAARAGGRWSVWDARLDERSTAELAALAARGPYSLDGGLLRARAAGPTVPAPPPRPPLHARALVLQRRFAAAAEEYLAAHQATGDPARLFEAGIALAAAGTPGASLRLLRQYRQAPPAGGPAAGEPPLPIARTREAFDRGQALAAQGRHADAANEFLVAALASDLAVAFFDAAVCMEKLDRPEAVVALYRRYLELGGDERNRAEVEKRIEWWAAEADSRLEPSARRAQPGALAEAEMRGALSIETSPPGATVYLDDKKSPLGLTPWSGTIEGPHRVILSLAGYEDAARDIVSRPRSINNLYIAMSKGHYLGFVEVRANVAGADVYIDSREAGAVGRTPWSGFLTPGKHRVIVTKAGYAEEARELDIVRGAIAKVEATLRSTP